MQAKATHDKGKRQPSVIGEGLPPQVATSHNKLLEQLAGIDQVLLLFNERGRLFFVFSY